MWSLDLLPRAKTVTFFDHSAGQAPSALGADQRPMEVAPPPRGQNHNLLIHMDLVEDWTPPRERTPSSGQSRVPSSISFEKQDLSLIYNFDNWTPGVLDGLRASPRVSACRPTPGGAPRRHDDGDDEGPRRPRHGFMERGKQELNLLRRGGASSSNTGEARQRTRSPPASRRWVTVGDKDG
jgi:hypothetical protein